MPAKTWSVWSWIADHGQWLEVGDGMSRADAEEGRKRKEASAAKFGIRDAAYVALPAGEAPPARPGPGSGGSEGGTLSGLPVIPSGEPGPECCCGSELKRVPLPPELAELSGQKSILIHVESGDTRCYPDSPNRADAAATAEPVEG